MPRCTTFAVLLVAGTLSAQATWRRVGEIEPHFGAGMAFDAARGECLLFGGEAFAEQNAAVRTWVFDGTSWQLRAPAMSPSVRGTPALAYDVARRRVVLFGGWAEVGGQQVVLDDTWEWDGTTWLQRLPATVPPGRASHALASDPGRQRVVMFGGSSRNASGHIQLGDTWEWDGIDWALRVPSSAPSPRYGHAMAADANRGRIVLFGGFDPNWTTDTWEWDGLAWTAAQPVVTPPSRGRHQMVWDDRRGRVTVFGGAGQNRAVFDDLWQWDGATWQQVVAPTRPTGRWHHAAAFDTARGRLVTFGGEGPAGEIHSDTWEWDASGWRVAVPATTPHTQFSHTVCFDARRGVAVLFGGSPPGFQAARDETWEWNGQTWAQAVTATTPPGRELCGLAFDAARGETLMFGGASMGSSIPADTWVYDGVDWVRRSPRNTPSGRWSPSLCFDEDRGVVLMFGGGGQDDTWEWNGVDWRLRTPARRPPPRSDGGLGYDTRRGRAVLFGGWFNGAVLGDTWEWDGADWAQRRPSRAPAARYRHGTAWDAVRERIVVFGGEGASLPALGDTWEWDGVDWTLRAPAVSAPGRLSHSMTFDSVRGEILVHGGIGVDQRSLASTWVYATPGVATATGFGAGCPATTGLVGIRAASRPWVGDRFDVELDNLPAPSGPAFVALGASDARWGSTALPLRLDPIGMPGCQLLVSVDLAVGVPASNHRAPVSLPIPNTPALVGGRMFVQGIAVAPSANPLGVVVSAGLAARFGVR